MKQTPMAETDEWRDFRVHPTETGDEERTVLVWHIYQGVLTVQANKCHENRFYEYWRELPVIWTDTAGLEPGADDADFAGCVIAQNRMGLVRMIGWKQVAREPRYYPRWMRAPDGPENEAALRKEVR